jgi:hypothetical protein
VSEILIFCPQCRGEYREGFEVCSDCNVPLVRRLDVEASGDSLMPLAREKSFELVAELLDRLEKLEIPYVVQAGTALSLLDHEIVPKARAEAWEARIWVAQSMGQRAVEVFDDLLTEWRLEHGEAATSRYLDTPGSRLRRS